MAFHPLVNRAARRRAIDDAVAAGVSRFTARRKIMALRDLDVDQVVATECARAGVVPPEPVTEGVGAGEIIQGIKEFCEAHPELVAAIAKALLLLVGL